MPNVTRRKSRTLSRNSAPEEIREVAGELGVASDEMSYTEASRLLKICQARLAEIELEQKRGELMLVSDHEKTIFNLARLSRDAMLAIPDRLAAELAGISDPFEAHVVLTREIRAAIMAMIEKGEREREES
ncbi:MAG: hypothetical protein KGM83_11320 [Betaproteobacteria bacterium]|nr:hypothetical protein [Betaproteobacteria bacterium]